MKRRELLRVISLGAAAAAAPISLAAAGSRKFDFGLQLSTITSLMNEDFRGSLQQVSHLGYKMVEFSARGFLGRDPNEVRNLLQEFNLSAPVGRVTPALPANYSSLAVEQQNELLRPALTAEQMLQNVESVLDLTVSMGQKFLNVPYLPATDFQTRGQVEQIAQLFNEAGALCNKRGVLFGYHNHDWELKQIEGIRPYDLLLAETDPALVSFQLDTYWITKGGGDLNYYLRQHAGRFPTVHLKDIDAAGDFEDVGYGLINFPDFIPLAIDSGTKYFFVERDGPTQPLNSITRSYQYLSALGPL